MISNGSSEDDTSVPSMPTPVSMKSADTNVAAPPASPSELHTSGTVSTEMAEMQDIGGRTELEDVMVLEKNKLEEVMSVSSGSEYAEEDRDDIEDDVDPEDNDIGDGSDGFEDWEEEYQRKNSRKGKTTRKSEQPRASKKRTLSKVS